MRRGLAGRGDVRRGAARQGLFELVALRESFWQDQAMQGVVRRGEVGCGWVWQGLFQELVALREFSGHSQARQGNAAFGPEWHGMARTL